MELWSIAKYQVPSTKSQGFRCRVSGVREEKELKPETSVFVVWNFYSSITPKPLAIFTDKVIQR